MASLTRSNCRLLSRHLTQTWQKPLYCQNLGALAARIQYSSAQRLRAAALATPYRTHTTEATVQPSPLHSVAQQPQGSAVPTFTLTTAALSQGLESLTSSLLLARGFQHIHTKRAEFLKHPIILKADPASCRLNVHLPQATLSVERIEEALAKSKRAGFVWTIKSTSHIVGQLTSGTLETATDTPSERSFSNLIERALYQYTQATRLPIRATFQESLQTPTSTTTENTLSDPELPTTQDTNTRSFATSLPLHLQNEKEPYLYIPLSPPLAATAVLKNVNSTLMVDPSTDIPKHEQTASLYTPSSAEAGSLFFLPPHRSLKQMFFTPLTFLLNYRFYLVFMARTTFQAARPLLVFCVFGEVLKLALAVMSSGLFIFFFSFLLAFEVLYFFLQCYITYVFLGMFFTAAF